MSTPFLRVIPRKVDEHFFANYDSLVLIALTQSLHDNQNTQIADDEKIYKTTKINIFDFNGLKKANQGLWEQVDARITDQHRRLQFILIERNLLYGLCPIQKNDPKSCSVEDGCFDELSKHGELTFTSTLKDLSTMARRDLNNSTGHNRVRLRSLVRVVTLVVAYYRL